METIRTIYQELFSVKFLHPAYGSPGRSSIAGDISVTADEDTKTLFTSYHIGYRMINNVLVCFIQSELALPPAAQPKMPHIKFAGPVRIRFFIRSSAAFVQQTHVVAAGSKFIYQFSNKINNTTATNVFLIQAVESHSLLKDYQGGTIVKSGAQLYAAKKNVFAVDNTPVTDTNFWKLIGPHEAVVNNSDLQANDTVQASEKCFGVIDIYNTGTIDAKYELYDINQHLKSPVFTIPFKSKF